jgi:hypothetical protein
MNETNNAEALPQAEHNQNIDARAGFSAESKREFLLASMRTARARLQSIVAELDEIGVSLKLGMISAEGAVTWLDYVGAVEFINVEPFTNKIEVVS